MSKACYYSLNVRRDSEVNEIADRLLFEIREQGKMTKPELFRQCVQVVYELAKAGGGRVVARRENGRIVLNLEP